MCPYIDQRRRTKDTERFPQGPGELNYALTVLIRDYFVRSGENYKAINDVVGALENAKLEFYRRVAVPYEDRKAQINGDVY